LGFNASGSGSYSRNLTSLLVGYIQSTYSANGSLSRDVLGWNVGLSASYSNSRVDAISFSDSKSTGYSLSLSHKSLGLSGNYSRNKGSGLQVGNIIVPTPVPGPLPQYLILFAGEAYGGGVSYRPLRRWTMSGNFTKLKYDTTNLGLNSNNSSEQLYFRTEYHFRQMFFNAGYSHLKQGFGVGAVQPATLDTVFVGVSRRFDFF